MLADESHLLVIPRSWKIIVIYDINHCKFFKVYQLHQETDKHTAFACVANVQLLICKELTALLLLNFVSLDTADPIKVTVQTPH